jgi:hypothetical protein
MSVNKKNNKKLEATVLAVVLCAGLPAFTGGARICFIVLK